MPKFTHNDIQEGDTLTLAHRNPDYKVLQILDGYRGIQVERRFNPGEPMWIDVEEVKSVRRKLA